MMQMTLQWKSQPCRILIMRMASGRRSQRKRRRRKSTRKFRTRTLFSKAVTPVVTKVTIKRKKRKENTVKRPNLPHL
uniref:Alternative protein TWISTNB n=1 Tax=Homo sapiens TaxID=9606 RepID=L8E9H7_HUMAN|nr:alternative protein TWISTNB [Homo sapiens]